MTRQELHEHLLRSYPTPFAEWQGSRHFLAINLDASSLTEMVDHLVSDPALHFDYLIALYGVDNGPEKGTLEVHIHLRSFTRGLQIGLVVIVSRVNPEVPSISAILPAAEWHEREVYDMFGISFIGHPDLRRILMPADWHGFPLRKDYEDPPLYHTLPVPNTIRRPI